MNSCERIEQIRSLDPEQLDPYVCDGCGGCFPALIAEAVYDLECPNCLEPLYVDD